MDTAKDDPGTTPDPLDRLVAEGVIDTTQAEAVRTALAAPAATGTVAATGPAAADAPGRRATWVKATAEIAAYLGTVFLGSAVLVLVGPYWFEFEHWQRTTVLVTTTVLLSVAGLLTARLDDRSGPSHRLATVLAAASSVMAGLLALHESNDHSALLLGTSTTLLCAALWYLLRRGAVLLLLVGAAAGTAVVALVYFMAWPSDYSVGLGLVAIALPCAVGAVTGLLRERATALVVTATLWFAGASSLVVANGEAPPEPTTGLGFTLLALLTGMYLGTGEGTALAAGFTVAAVGVPWAVSVYTDGVFGVGMTLLVTGLALICSGAAALWLKGHREVAR